MHVVDRLQRLIAQLHQVGVKRVDVFLELLHGGGADDGGGAVPSRAAPRQRERRERDPSLLRDRIVRLRRLHGRRVQVPLHEVGVLHQPALRRLLAVEILAGEGAARERCPREQADVVVARRARLRELRLERAVQQAERVLDRHRPGHAELVGGADKLADSVGGLVA